MRIKLVDSRPRQKHGRREKSWGWWENLESFGLGSSRYSGLTDEDEVPDQHTEFDPSPPVHAFAR